MQNSDIKIGYISLLDISDDEFESLLDYLEYKKKLPSVRYIASLLGKEAFLEFLDLFSSDVVKIPNRGESIKILNYISIYHYLKDRDFSDSAYQKARSLYRRKIDSLHSIVDVMENLYSSDLIEEDDLDE
jgi:hypothetical protein